MTDRLAPDYPAVGLTVNALRHAEAWIGEIPHGDNCYVSDHYAGDPGNQCNCGKEAVLAAIEEALIEEESTMDESKALQDVIAERQRQIQQEGWTPEHDDQHADGAMAKAASAYALWAALPDDTRAAHPKGEPPLPIWPWADKWWKPENPRRDLVRAAALIVAEIERIDRRDALRPSDPSRRDSTT